MTLRQICETNNNTVIISLPDGFKHTKRVMVIIDDNISTKEDKIALMKQAANDPLYLKDMDEVQADFDAIEHETL